ncbi:MAG: ribosome recycling factor [Bacteroidetes bacterium SW_11_45_7]|nr:MAG: ribosome recycling factor [Bacteroidetes bacterium SW_11_45_7]
MSQESQDTDQLLQETEKSMKKSIDHLEAEVRKIRAGKADPNMLDDILVEYYGMNTPLNQLANVTTPDAKTIVIQPFEKSMLEPIEKAIHMANIGLNPTNDGSIIRINIPTLTEERRKELTKKVKAEAENARVSIRNSRKETNNKIKAMQKEGLSEDEAKVAEDEVQELTDKYIGKVDSHLQAKEEELMNM